MDIKFRHEWHTNQAVRVLRQGGVVAYPTESVYGLGCDPLYGPAVMRILHLKHRSLHKGLILIASTFDHLLEYIQKPNHKMKQQLMASWPGAVTWLLPAREDVPIWLCGSHATLAVRITAHPLARLLCERFGGAIVSTSANISTRPAAKDSLSVRRIFGKQINYYLHGDVGQLPTPTEIRDAMSGAIVRAS